MSKILKSLADGILKIGDTELDVAVLEDGARVISHNAVFRALGREPRGNSRQDQTPAFMDAKNLQNLISSDLRAMIKRVPYLDKDGNKKEGFNAEILPLVADLYLRAREAGILTPQQIPTAQKAEMLVRSLARIGITALVDEATGYQYERAADALKLLLEKYLRTEHAVWVKRFPVEFFKEIYRLRGWKFDARNIKNHPQIVGAYINDIVYTRLAPGILEELQNLNKKNEKGNRPYKHHQFLTDDIGSPALQQHLFAVITLMRASGSWEGFMRLLNKSLPKKNAQLFLELDE